MTVFPSSLNVVVTFKSSIKQRKVSIVRDTRINTVTENYSVPDSTSIYEDTLPIIGSFSFQL